MSKVALLPKMRLYKEWVCPECCDTQEYRKGQRAPHCKNAKWHRGGGEREAFIEDLLADARGEEKKG